MLKAVLSKDDYDTLAESDKQHYKLGEDGRYYAQVESVSWKDGTATTTWALENVGALTTTLAKLKEQLGQVKTQHKTVQDALGEIDPQEAVTAYHKLKELGEIPGEGDIKKELEQRTAAIQAALEKKHTNALEAAKAETDKERKLREQRDAQLKAQLIDNAAIRAIESQKGNVEVLLPHVQRRCRCVPSDQDGQFVVEVLDAAGNTAYGTDAKPMNIGQLVEEFKGSTTYAVLFEGTSARGSGASSGGRAGGNMFTLTQEQAKDTALYRRTKEQAEKAGQTLQILEK